MGAMTTLCNRGILLNNGSIIMDGEIKDVVAHYLNEVKDLTGHYVRDASEPVKKLTISQITLRRSGDISTQYYNMDTLSVNIDIIVKTAVIGAQIGITLYTGNNDCLFTTTSQDWTEMKEIFEPGTYHLTCPIQLKTLRQGKYYITASSSVPAVEMLDAVEKQLFFEILDEPRCILQLGQGRRGMTLPVIQWTVEKT